jgi:transglutaminase-like putative cysteine protease
MTILQSPRAAPPGARAGLLLAALAALGIIAYPRPRLLVRTVLNAVRPDIDAEAVEALAAGLSDDPEALRAEVLSTSVPYERDWAVFGVPYYFPTLAEVLENGRGDCKSQVLVLASLLRAKGVPFRLLASLDHVWAEYPGKTPTVMEDPAVALAEYRDGRWRPLRPQRLRPRAHLAASVDEYWRGASQGRRLAFAWVLVLAAVLAIRSRKTHGSCAPGRADVQGRRRPDVGRGWPSSAVGGRASGCSTTA